jgi:multidrug efflux pump subunit AcrA (membrane-fusion protein)
MADQETPDDPTAKAERLARQLSLLKTKLIDFQRSDATKEEELRKAKTARAVAEEALRRAQASQTGGTQFAIELRAAEEKAAKAKADADRFEQELRAARAARKRAEAAQAAAEEALRRAQSGTPNPPPPPPPPPAGAVSWQDRVETSVQLLGIVVLLVGIMTARMSSATVGDTTSPKANIDQSFQLAALDGDKKDLEGKLRAATAELNTTKEALRRSDADLKKVAEANDKLAKANDDLSRPRSAVTKAPAPAPKVQTLANWGRLNGVARLGVVTDACDGKVKWGKVDATAIQKVLDGYSVDEAKKLVESCDVSALIKKAQALTIADTGGIGNTTTPTTNGSGAGKKGDCGGNPNFEWVSPVIGCLPKVRR